MNGKEQILNDTDGGRTIIERLYGNKYGNRIQFRGAKTNQFKIRDERTASAIAVLRKGIWYVTDFGGDQKGRNPIDCYIYEQNLHGMGFGEVIKKIAFEFNIIIS